MAITGRSHRPDPSSILGFGSLFLIIVFSQIESTDSVLSISIDEGVVLIMKKTIAVKCKSGKIKSLGSRI